MSSLPEERPEHPTAQPPAPTGIQKTEDSGSGKLSSHTITNILIITIVGVVSILLLLFGNFEGKISRVVSTLLLFAIFTFISSNDVKRLKASGVIRFAQASNIYMLVLTLVLIWGSLAVERYEDATLLPLTFFIAALVKAGELGVEKLAPLIRHPQKQLSLAACLTTAGFIALTVLFTIPMGLYRMASLGEGYWRFTVAVVLFTALALSVSLIIVWALRRDTPAAPRSFSAPSNAASAPPMDVRPQQPVEAAVPNVVPAPQVQAPQFARPVPAVLPWPVFPDGRPLPVKGDGRPDFNALVTVASSYEKAERQFFG